VKQILCIKLVNYWDKYTEMHSQQNVKKKKEYVICIGRQRTVLWTRRYAACISTVVCVVWIRIRGNSDVFSPVLGRTDTWNMKYCWRFQSTSSTVNFLLLLKLKLTTYWSESRLSCLGIISHSYFILSEIILPMTVSYRRAHFKHFVESNDKVKYLTTAKLQNFDSPCY